MCGRFTQSASIGDIAKRFRLEPPGFEVKRRYNIAPSQDVAVVLEEKGRRQLSLLRWGLVPHWAKDAKIGFKRPRGSMGRRRRTGCCRC